MYKLDLESYNKALRALLDSEQKQLRLKMQIKIQTYHYL